MTSSANTATHPLASMTMPPSAGSTLASGIGTKNTAPCAIGTKIASQRRNRCLRRSRQSSAAVRNVYADTVLDPREQQKHAEQRGDAGGDDQQCRDVQRERRMRGGFKHGGTVLRGYTEPSPYHWFHVGSCNLCSQPL